MKVDHEERYGGDDALTTKNVVGKMTECIGKLEKEFDIDNSDNVAIALAFNKLNDMKSKNSIGRFNQQKDKMKIVFSTKTMFTQGTETEDLDDLDKHLQEKENSCLMSKMFEKPD